MTLYDLFHKKDTFFSWNRLYLIITPILSLIFPFIKIQTLNISTPQGYVSQLERVITISSENLTVLGTTGTEQNPINWWLILYFVGVGISLFTLILKFHKLNVMQAFSFTSHIKNRKIVTLPNSTQAFSFWNTIYLGDGLSEEEKKQILIHEIVHVEQKHSLDQLYFEILKVFLWWNPLIYINQSRITVLHEYLADAAVISSISKKNYIHQLLNATFQTQEVTFVNQFFNQSLIKKRILMLQKTKSKSIAKFKYLLLVPAITGILTYTSCSQRPNTNKEKETIEVAEEIKTDLAENTTNQEEPRCPNQNAEYNKNIDNFIEITNGENAEVILNVISIESSKNIRTIYLSKNHTYRIQNIPEGKYKLDIKYGDGYTEKIVNGVCTAFFKNEKFKETGNDILDMNTVKTDKGLNVPSYRLSVDLTDDDHKHDENPS
ncbi:M56 family metallopeptidase [Aquimarina mytili]